MAEEDKIEEQEDQTDGDEAEGEEGEDGEEGEGSSGGKSKKMLLIIILAGVLVGGAVAAGVFLFLGGEDEAEIPEEPVVELQSVAFYDMQQISVNLLTDGRSSRYLKLKVSLELESEADVVALEQLLPRIVDDFQVFLRQLRVEDIQGSGGIQRLKRGLLLRARQSAEPVKVRNVLFKEILVQ